MVDRWFPARQLWLAYTETDLHTSNAHTFTSFTEANLPRFSSEGLYEGPVVKCQHVHMSPVTCGALQDRGPGSISI